MAEGRSRERMLAGAVDRLGDDLSEDRREDVQARLGARSCRACEAGPHTCGLPSADYRRAALDVAEAIRSHFAGGPYDRVVVQAVRIAQYHADEGVRRG